MAVHILTARPHRLFDGVIHALENHQKQRESAILLVPEQLTLTSERELMERLHLQSMFTLEVLSPSRLHDHILADAGHDDREPLSDAGRRMAISQALEKLENKLPYYGSIAQRKGFVEKLSALITDMKRGGMTPEMLRTHANTLEEGVPKQKLCDLALIYEQYTAVLKGRFSDSEDQLSYIAKKLSQSAYLNEKHLYVYGFDTLPEQMMRLLCAAAPLCKSLTVALLCDGESAADGELYAPIRQGMARFAKMLAQDGIDCLTVPLPPQPLGHEAAIDHLDNALFVTPPKPFAQKPNSVFLWAGLSPYEEATRMTRQVRRLLDEGMDIERIAVLYPGDSGYDFAVTAALADSGIPFYTDRQLPALCHALVRFLLSALHAMSDGWRSRDVLNVLKSGYAPCTFAESCLLESYVHSHGIDRKRWTQPFTRGEETLREQCEPIRSRLMEPLIKCRQALVDARDAASSMGAVMQLLLDVNAYETLRQEEERLLQNGFIARANQNSQIWQAIITLMDQAVRLNGSARIPLKSIAQRMECGFAALSLASLPPAGHMLHAGTLGHLLVEEADAVFLMGLSDGLLTHTTDSLLTAEERDEVQQQTGCFLGLTDENRTWLAKLDLKRAMTLPTQHLFLSYALTAADGTVLRPLSLLRTLEHGIFPALDASPVPSDALPLSPAQTLSQLGVLLRSHADGADSLPIRWQQRLQALLAHPATAGQAMQLLRALRHDGAAQPLSANQARALYGESMLSVSRLERFAECPFKHYLTYGLRPHIPREWKVDPIDTGNFYHDGLNNFAKLARREAKYPHLPSETVERMADAAMEPLLQDVLTGPMGDGERSHARFERACNAIRRAALTMTRHLAAGRFAVYRTEASFGYENGMPPIVLVLGDGREVALRGRIDRIDRYDAPDGVYLRVIDYKSSRQTLEAARTWWGLRLQLLLYLDVCTSAIPGAKPAGAFYFYVADPLVESESDVQEVVESKLRTLFHLKGVTLADVEILSAMDGGDVPWVLPPQYQKNGELYKTAHALDLPQMRALLTHAKDVAAQLAQRLFDGETDISPARDAGRTSCDLCEFSSICHFDGSASDAPFRDVPSMSMEALRAALTPHPKP